LSTKTFENQLIFKGFSFSYSYIASDL